MSDKERAKAPDRPRGQLRINPARHFLSKGPAKGKIAIQTF
jgi:hypothetical protein